jgi:hypothetical protein
MDLQSLLNHYKIWVAEQQGDVQEIPCHAEQIKFRILAESITSSILIIKSFSHFSLDNSHHSPNLFNNLLEQLRIKSTHAEKRFLPKGTCSVQSLIPGEYREVFSVNLTSELLRLLYFCAQT